MVVKSSFALNVVAVGLFLFGTVLVLNPVSIGANPNELVGGAGSCHEIVTNICPVVDDDMCSMKECDPPVEADPTTTPPTEAEDAKCPAGTVENVYENLEFEKCASNRSSGYDDCGAVTGDEQVCYKTRACANPCMEDTVMMKWWCGGPAGPVIDENTKLPVQVFGNSCPGSIALRDAADEGSVLLALMGSIKN